MIWLSFFSGAKIICYEMLENDNRLCKSIGTAVRYVYMYRSSNRTELERPGC